MTTDVKSTFSKAGDKAQWWNSTTGAFKALDLIPSTNLKQKNFHSQKKKEESFNFFPPDLCNTSLVDPHQSVFICCLVGGEIRKIRL